MIDEIVNKNERINIDEEAPKMEKMRKHPRGIHNHPREIEIKSEKSEINGNMMWNCNRVDSHVEDEMEPPVRDRLLNFEEFNKVMKERMIMERENMKDFDIVFESQASNVSCLFWPY